MSPGTSHEESPPDGVPQPWWYLVSDRRVLLLVVLGLALLAGYQVWAQGQSQKVSVAVKQSNQNTVKLARLTSAQCAQTLAFYTLINQLLDDSSPHFASPVGGPIIPGARSDAIARVRDLEEQSYAQMRTQGCKIKPKGNLP